jgi:class 3 adenylate cyclase
MTFNANVVDGNDVTVSVLYLVVFFLGQAYPVAVREYASRQNYFRRYRIRVEKRKLGEEEARSNKLLTNLLPAEIVPRLRAANRALIADSFDDVTILWTDMKGFTNFSSSRGPMEIVAFLNAMFSTFDRILDKYGIRKVEVLGDAFFVVGGCPVPIDDHAERCINAALEMQMHMPILRRFAGADISMRVGIHSGPVVAGVVGSKDPRYHLFGQTVPYANAMESNGEPGCVHISQAAYERVTRRQAERAAAFLAAVAAAGFAVPPEVAAGPTSSVGQYPQVHLELLDEYLRVEGLGAAAGGAGGTPGGTGGSRGGTLAPGGGGGGGGGGGVDATAATNVTVGAHRTEEDAVGAGGTTFYSARDASGGGGAKAGGDPAGGAGRGGGGSGNAAGAAAAAAGGGGKRSGSGGIKVVEEAGDGMARG